MEVHEIIADTHAQTSPLESLHTMLSGFTTTVKLKAEELHTALAAGETETAIAIAHKLHELGDALDPDNAAVHHAIYANEQPQQGQPINRAPLHPGSDGWTGPNGEADPNDPRKVDGGPLFGQAAFDQARADKADADQARAAAKDPQSRDVLKGKPRDDEKWDVEDHPAKPIGGPSDDDRVHC